MRQGLDQQVDMEQAFRDCFDRKQPLKRLPVFKKKGGGDAIRFPQGWFDFRRQLGYKLNWMGGSLVEVDFRYTSQRCSCCGYTAKENRKSQSEFVCLRCEYAQHADVNAALNILTVGQTGMACGSNRNDNRKQKPFRVRASKPAGTREEVLPVAS